LFESVRVATAPTVAVEPFGRTAPDPASGVTVLVPTTTTATATGEEAGSGTAGLVLAAGSTGEEFATAVVATAGVLVCGGRDRTVGAFGKLRTTG